MKRSRLAAPIALALLGACRIAGPPAAIDPAMSVRVPAATVALAGVDFDRLRASPLYARLPPAAAEFLAPFGRAHRALIAYSGGELLAIARGVVPGATQVEPNLALFGSPGLMAAAASATAHPSADVLLAAESVAAARPVWVAIRGGAALPLTGNWANVNNLLRGTESVTLAVQPADPVELELVARCPSPELAQRFELTFRAIVSLATAHGGLLGSARMSREERVVHVSLSVPSDALVQFLVEAHRAQAQH